MLSPRGDDGRAESGSPFEDPPRKARKRTDAGAEASGAGLSKKMNHS
jgi:hypothetical protein